MTFSQDNKLWNSSSCHFLHKISSLISVTEVVSKHPSCYVTFRILVLVYFYAVSSLPGASPPPYEEPCPWLLLQCTVSQCQLVCYSTACSQTLNTTSNLQSRSHSVNFSSWHSSGDFSLTYRSDEPSSSPAQFIWDLWQTKCQWGKVFSEYFRFSCQSSFTQYI
jgi:hypothetical protein